MILTVDFQTAKLTKIGPNFITYSDVLRKAQNHKRRANFMTICPKHFKYSLFTIHYILINPLS